MENRFLAFFILFALVRSSNWTRQVLTPTVTIDVNSTNDTIDSTDDLCTLREAVIAANTHAASGPGAGECPAGATGLDIIRMPTGTYLLTRAPYDEDNSAGGDLDVLEDLAVTGYTINDKPIIDGNYTYRIFDVFSDTQLSIQGITFRNGFQASGTSDGGGAILLNDADSDAIISWSIFEDNVGEGDIKGGAIHTRDGAKFIISDSIFRRNSGLSAGAIFTNGVGSQIKRCLFQENNASLGGGAIVVYGDLTVENSTFSGNSAGDNAGAIRNMGILRLSYSTIAQNTSGVSLTSGIYAASYSTTYLQGNILANNYRISDNSKSNCHIDGTMGWGTYNHESASTCSFNGYPNYNSFNPGLGPLGPFGGFSWTHPLLINSAAIDHAADPSCPSVDQRNVIRPVDGNNNGVETCDPGAFEKDIDIRLVFLPVVRR